ncbi:MAG: type II secretion system protein [Verrucomicrobiae bacterium]|nr:type II secretion system protein [Verrucomicrobiae bacterium]
MALKKNLFSQTDNRAFTLVEILAVIVILSMLFSLLLPAAKQMLGRTRASQCAAQLHDIGNAIQMYAHDYGERFPVIEPTPSNPIDPANPLPSLKDQLLKYVSGQEKVFRCPRDSTRWPVEGASYEWCYVYQNDLVDQPTQWFFRRRGSTSQNATKDPTKATILWDYENVHMDQGGEYVKNVLYADGHVGGI